MEIFPTDLHSSFSEALASLPSQRLFPSRSKVRGFFRRASPPPPPAPAARSLTSGELRKIANVGRNDSAVRCYFASTAELAERTGAAEATSDLYLQGLNDAIDAYQRFDARRSRVQQAINKIGWLSSYDEERQQLDNQLATVSDDVARQVLRNALDQLESRRGTLSALKVDLERVEARMAMIAQRLAAVHEALVLDSVSADDREADGSGLALLRDLNDDLVQDATFAQQAEAEHILQSINP